MPAVAKWDDRAEVVPFSTPGGRIFVIGNQNDKGMRKKRRTLDDFDSYEDYEDEMSAMEAAQPEVEHVSKQDFNIDEKMSAFIRDYEPCDEFDPGAERFGDAELRMFFKGYVHGLGDPLKLYVEDLKMAGFRMSVSLATGKPSIFARRKVPV